MSITNFQSAEKAVRAVLLSTGITKQVKRSQHDLLEELQPLREDEHLENVVTDLQNCIGKQQQNMYIVVYICGRNHST